MDAPASSTASSTAMTATGTAELDAVRRRRAELRETMAELERALSAAPTDDAASWSERVYSALVAVADNWREHVVVTEGPNGLHQAILAGDLRLANGVTRLAEEHLLIGEELAAAVLQCEPPWSDADGIDATRERGRHLLDRLVRHRQRGADLIYEAYAADLGGGD